MGVTYFGHQTFENDMGILVNNTSLKKKLTQYWAARKKKKELLESKSFIIFYTGQNTSEEMFQLWTSHSSMYADK